jgi:hypothetical protein
VLAATGAALRFLGGAAEVNALVGIAPDNHGTDLSGLTNLLPYFPGADDLPATVPGVRYTVIATKNVLLQELCPGDLSEHLAIGLFDRTAFHEVANALDPARARPTTCASAFSCARRGPDRPEPPVRPPESRSQRPCRAPPTARRRTDRNRAAAPTASAPAPPIAR